MLRLALLAIVLVLGLFVGPELAGNKGYVLIALEDTTIELTIISLVIMLFFALLAFLIIEWCLRRLIGFIAGSRDWLGTWGERNRQKAFTLGLQAHAAMNYSEARKQLNKIRQADFAGLNLLALADAEEHLGNHDVARELWQQTLSIPGAKLSASLHLARQALKQRQPAQAIAIIDALDSGYRQQKQFIELYARALADSEQWELLHEKLQTWKKVLGDRYAYWSHLAAEGGFAMLAGEQKGSELMAAWGARSKEEQQDETNQHAYISQLINLKMHQEAEKALVQAMKSGPKLSLLPLFKDLRLGQPKLSFDLLNKLVKKDPENARLHSTLGHLAFYNGDEELAERAIARAIELAHQHEDILLLADIKARQENQSEALALYKQAMPITRT